MPNELLNEFFHMNVLISFGFITIVLLIARVILDFLDYIKEYRYELVDELSKAKEDTNE